ncbi:hypothetical protein [Novosphingobium clariflavum]|uniref:Uncharacterized protein n=1 Tax=Novosphingobium clariflavum TaxID=2029884 RepID=A0ABV6S884_9SPHN|nr:hypothetical protein [Novosphingobium clariflavum]
MNDIPLSAALDAVRAAAEADPAMLNYIRAHLRTTGLFDEQPLREVRACPISFDAIEVALFDNWGSATKPKGSKTQKIKANRFGGKVKVWDEGKRINLNEPDFVAFVNFFDAGEVQALVERLANPRKCRTPLTAAYQELLLDVITPLASANDMLVAPLFSKPVGDGTRYHDQQVMMVPKPGMIAKDVQEALLILETGTVLLPPFSSNDASGSALKDNCFAQSRACLSRQFVDWSTGGIQVKLK